MLDLHIYCKAIDGLIYIITMADGNIILMSAIHWECRFSLGGILY